MKLSFVETDLLARLGEKFHPVAAAGGVEPFPRNDS
jgi:hypothetical protein